jgi:hypothetical protein
MISFRGNFRHGKAWRGLEPAPEKIREGDRIIAALFRPNR